MLVWDCRTSRVIANFPCSTKQQRSTKQYEDAHYFALMSLPPLIDHHFSILILASIPLVLKVTHLVVDGPLEPGH